MRRSDVISYIAIFLSLINMLYFNDYNRGGNDYSLVSKAYASDARKEQPIIIEDDGTVKIKKLELSSLRVVDDSDTGIYLGKAIDGEEGAGIYIFDKNEQQVAVVGSEKYGAIKLYNKGSKNTSHVPSIRLASSSEGSFINAIRDNKVTLSLLETNEISTIWLGEICVMKDSSLMCNPINKQHYQVGVFKNKMENMPAIMTTYQGFNGKLAKGSLIDMFHDNKLIIKNADYSY